MTKDNCRRFKQNQVIFCICARVVEDSRPIDFGEDRLRGRGSSVSYTHLDVYKRQPSNIVKQLWPQSRPRSTILHILQEHS